MLFGLEFNFLGFDICPQYWHLVEVGGCFTAQYGWLRTDGQFEGARQTYHVRHTSTFSFQTPIGPCKFIQMHLSLSDTAQKLDEKKTMDTRMQKPICYVDAFCETFKYSWNKWHFSFSSEKPTRQLCIYHSLLLSFPTAAAWTLSIFISKISFGKQIISN